MKERSASAIAKGRRGQRQSGEGVDQNTKAVVSTMPKAVCIVRQRPRG